MTEADNPAGDGPYFTAAPTYFKAGWSPLPIPYGQKKPVPVGWTGRDGQWPSFPDIHTWMEDVGHSNIAVRMPPSVLGVDCDDYKDKPGAAVLDQLQNTHGPLPPTWTSSSRGGRSGIRFYRIPEGLRWPGILGPGIETIRFDHRYAVVWPSVHPEGGTYRWTRPDGAIALDDIPQVDELPALPDTWVQALTNGVVAGDQPRADLTDQAASTWLRNRSGVIPCRVMQTVAGRGRTELGSGESRHDTALSLTNRIIWLAGEGHHGVDGALAVAKVAFDAVTRDRPEPGEWDRMVAGAVRLSAAAHPTPQPDPCDNPFHGLIPKGDTPWPPTHTLLAPTPSSKAPTTSPASPMPSNGSPTSSTQPTPPTSSAPSTTSTSTLSDVETTTERTTWWPRNLEPTLNGEQEEHPPTHLTRSDHHRLFYTAKVNGIIGPSESGKTWVALQTVVEAVHEEQQATIIDFEDNHTGTIGRLITLGLTPNQIRRWVAYINPDEPFSRFHPSGLDLTEHLADWEPELIIVDGVNAAMTLQNLDLISNKDATIFAQHILKPLANTGACVVYVDHTPKAKDNTAAGGIGAQAKRAMTTGCTLKIDPIKPFGKGQDGKLRAYVDKDRAGHIRGVSLPSNGTHWAADILITPTGPDTIRLAVNAPEGYDAVSGSYAFRPTIYMRRISEWLQDNPGAGRNEIIAGVTGEPTVLKHALTALVGEGWVKVDKVGQKHPHTNTMLFDELLTGPTGVDRGWTGVANPGVGGGVGIHTSPPHQPQSATPVPNHVKTTIAGRQVTLNKDTGKIVEDTP